MTSADSRDEASTERTATGPRIADLLRAGRSHDALEALESWARSSRRPDVLRCLGHLLRRRRRFADSAAALTAARGAPGWGLDDDLALVEARLASGDLAGAREALPAGQGGSALCLAQAAVAQAEGRTEDALDALLRVSEAPPFGHQMAQRILAVVGTAPSTPGALRALDAIPQAARGDSFWTLRGNVHAAAGASREAMEDWTRVRRPSVELAARRKGAAIRVLAEAVETGDAARCQEAMALHGRALAQDDEGAAWVVAALIVLACAAPPRDALEGVPGHAALSPAVATVLPALLESFPGLGERAPARRVLALLALERGETTAGLEPLLEMAKRGALDDEARFVALRSALAAGDVPAVDALVAGLAGDDPRAAVLKAVTAMRREAWAEAADAWAAPEIAGRFLDQRAAACLRAGRWAEMEEWADRHPHALLCRAVARALGARPAEAREDVERAAADPAQADAAARIGRWVEDGRGVQAAHQSLEDVVAQARARPGDPVVLAALSARAHEVIEQALAADDRDLLRLVLESPLAAGGTGRPDLSHRLCLFHWAEGARHAGAGRWSDAVAGWERAAAHLGVVLAMPAHLLAWSRRRAASHGSAATAADLVALERDVVGALERAFTQASERAAADGAREASNALAALVPTLRCEVRGARLLAGLGGLGDAAQTTVVAFGPAYAALYGLEHAVGEQAAARRQAQQVEGFVPGLLAPLEPLFSGNEGTDPLHLAARWSGTREMELMYSCARWAALLRQEGQPEEALRQLRADVQTCFPLGQPGTCPGPMGSACAARKDHFAACNPAFAAKDGPAAMREAFRDLEVALLLDAGARALRGPPEKSTEALGVWAQALVRTRTVHQEDWVREHVRQAVLGRAEALWRAGHGAAALGLVEGARPMCDGEQLRGLLARLLAAAAIDAANDENDWERAAADLQRAHDLNPHGRVIACNLARAVLGRARHAPSSTALGRWRDAVRIVAALAADQAQDLEIQSLAAEARHGCADALSSAAEEHAAKGDGALAVAALEEALPLSGEEPEAQARLVAALRALAARGRAAAQWLGVQVALGRARALAADAPGLEGEWQAALAACRQAGVTVYPPQQLAEMHARSLGRS